MWLLEWPRLKKLYTIEVDSERTAAKGCCANKTGGSLRRPQQRMCRTYGARHFLCDFPHRCRGGLAYAAPTALLRGLHQKRVWITETNGGTTTEFRNEGRAAAKALRRLATKIKAERLRAGGQGWDQHLGLRRAEAGDVVISGEGIAQCAAGAVGAGGDRVKIGGQARFSHGVD